MTLATEFDASTTTFKAFTDGWRRITRVSICNQKTPIFVKPSRIGAPGSPRGSFPNLLAATADSDRFEACGGFDLCNELNMVFVFFDQLARREGLVNKIVTTLLLGLKGSSQDELKLVEAAAEEAAGIIQEFFIKRGYLVFGNKDFVEDMDIQNMFDHVSRLLKRVSKREILESLDRSLNMDLDSDCDLELKILENYFYSKISERESPQRSCSLLSLECTSPEFGSNEAWWNTEMVLGDAVSNVIDELTRPPRGLAILKIFETANGPGKDIPRQVFHLCHQFLFRAWVHGMSNTCQVLSKILLAVAPNSTNRGEVFGQNIEEIGTLLCENLKERKYLIILSGLLDFQIWDVIQSYFPDDNLGSRVLLSCVLNPETSWKQSVQDEDTVMVGRDKEMGIMASLLLL